MSAVGTTGLAMKAQATNDGNANRCWMLLR
jgi:hypothetical protein